MKHFYIILLALLMLAPVPVTTQDVAAASTTMTKKEKEKAKKAKAKAKAQAKKAKEKAKKAKKKQKEQAKKAKAKAKAQAKKAKAKAKAQAQKQKELAKKQAAAAKNASATAKPAEVQVAETTKPQTVAPVEVVKVDTPIVVEHAATTAPVNPAATAPIVEAETSPRADASKQLKGKLTTSQDLHYLSLWGNFGYSGMHGNYKSAQEGAMVDGVPFRSQYRGSAGMALGVGYALKHNDFIFRVGPEFRLLGSEDMLRVENNHMEGVHPAYPETMKQYYDFEHLREDQAVGQIMLPVLAGMNIDKYYWMAGAKFGYTMMSRYHHRGKLTTSVKDSWAIGNWGDMPTHDLVREEYGKHPLVGSGVKGKSGLNALDVTLSAEGGIILNEFLPAAMREKLGQGKGAWLMRLGGFIDYGLPLTPAGKADGAHPLVVDNGVLVSSSLHQSAWAQGKLSSIFVGVKFVAEMQLNQPKNPDPRMAVSIHNIFTGAPITGAHVEVVEPESQRSLAKNLNGVSEFQECIPAGVYHVQATAPGYLPGPVMRYSLEGDLLDTVLLKLIPIPSLAAYVHDAKTEALIPATLTYVSRTDKEETEAYSYGDKPATASLTYGEVYDVKIEAEGYHSQTAEVSDLYSTTHYSLDPLVRVRRTLILKNMYFATAKADILPGSEEDIERLYNFLVENPAIRVQIVGHTDSQGNDNYNQRLSEARALSLKTVMVERGIDEDRIETAGMGETMPIDTNDTAEGRQNNRRIEVTVLNAEDAEVDVY